VNEGYLRFTNAGAPGRGRSQRRPVAALRHSASSPTLRHRSTAPAAAIAWRNGG